MLKSPVAWESGSVWFVLNEGTRGMVKARTSAMLWGCQRSANLPEKSTYATQSPKTNQAVNLRVK